MLVTKQLIDEGLEDAAINALDPATAVRFGSDDVQTALALSQLEPGNLVYLRNAANAHRTLSIAMWNAGQLREALAQSREAIEEFRRVPSSSSTLTDFFGVIAELDLGTKQAQIGERVQSVTGDTAINSATAGARAALGGGPGVFALVQYEASGVIAAKTAYERSDFDGARRIARDTLAHLRAVGHRDPNPSGLCLISGLEGSADYNLGDFAAAEQAQRVAMQACLLAANTTGDRRDAAQAATWLAMTLAREGKQMEAARIIDPVVTMDLEMERKNRSDAWLPLEVASGLYAQSLAEPQRRTALLQGAAERISHLTAAIAGLHDTREWHKRIESAQHATTEGVAR